MNVEKLKEILSLIVVPTNRAIEEITQSLRSDFENTSEGLSPARIAAVAEYEQNLLSASSARNEVMAKIFTESFTEAEADTLLAFYKEPAANRVGEISGKLFDAHNEWLQRTLERSVALKSMIDQMATQWVSANAGYEVIPPGADTTTPAA